MQADNLQEAYEAFKKFEVEFRRVYSNKPLFVCINKKLGLIQLGYMGAKRIMEQMKR